VAAKRKGQKPTSRELASTSDDTLDYGWPLEVFAGDLFLRCHEGSLFESINENRIQNLFNRRSGPIYAAIAITVEDTTQEGAA
jgi:hypothetical protein